MTRVSSLALSFALPLAACAGQPPARAVSAIAPAPFLAPAVLVPSAPTVRAASFVEGDRLSLPPDRRISLTGSPLSRVDAANRSAVREPSRERYVNAVQVYPWSEGALYRLYTAPERISEIALEPGEALVSVAAGDTARWVIGDTASGSGASRRTHILVKPTMSGLRTNLLIATDRRVYRVQLESTAATAMASISWTYPEGSLIALTRPGASIVPSIAGSGQPLNTGYRIEGDNPRWRPIRAFDDGAQVFIEFPPALAQGEAPPLFVRGSSGKPELVNYRVRGLYYVVDRLFEVAELRLGEKRQQVVRIVRVPAALSGRRRRAS